MADALGKENLKEKEKEKLAINLKDVELAVVAKELEDVEEDLIKLILVFPKLEQRLSQKKLWKNYIKI